MRRLPDQVAFALVIVAAAVAAVGFVAVAAAASCACLLAWNSDDRRDLRRLPLLLQGAVLLAFGAFTLRSIVDDGAGALVLEVAGLAGVAIAVLALSGRRR